MSRSVRHNRRRVNEAAQGIAFITPTTLVLFALVLYPFLYGIYVSFFKTNLINKWTFVGLSNYKQMLSGSDFWKTLLLTLVFTVGVVVGHFALGFLFANILNKKFRGRTLFRVLLLLPWLLPEVVAANVFKWILHPTNGVLNYWMVKLHLLSKPISWLGNPKTAMAVVIFICIWKGFPLVMLQILAGLQTIPAELQEAARVDGANDRQVFWKITLPALKPTLIVALVLDTIWWFKHVTIIWLLTQGGPGTSTTTIAVDIYKQAFQYFHFGPASALAVIVFAICLVINYVYKKALNNEED
ncbi:sugar ABC transporter permease [Bifidobacterium sp. ESL0732]|uniref:carbohydrate ABC transporter permease n=1 Tax=Bifidobacterium sp. ESL0732 TaxID=2983222 RepID=UPI0023F88D8B|nr:sugar ABC transporter permease [Bifidobacterium sp. ESL0732]WEV63911.1 sugar ABC transporter permease [Bifidobacterium sp. ESL0732]